MEISYKNQRYFSDNGLTLAFCLEAGYHNHGSKCFEIKDIHVSIHISSLSLYTCIVYINAVV